MSHEQPRERASMPLTTTDRGRLAGPRLELPRFQFSPSASLARTEPRAAAAAVPAPTPTPMYRAQAAPLMAPAAPAVRSDLQPAHLVAPQVHPQPHYAAPAAPQQYAAPAPQWHQPQQAPVQHVTYAAAPAPVTQAPPAPAAARPAPSPFANATRPAQVTWSEPTRDKTLLERVSPVHMGALLMMVIVAMVVTSGPAAMSAKPARLPALASGGGTGTDGMPIRAGSTAVAAATPAAAAAPATTATAKVAAPAKKVVRARVAGGPRMIAVGSGRVSSKIRSGGIPSPAASANLAIAGGGRAAAGSTSDVHMNGIPSAAASEKLGPQQLPFRANDGVTLPRSSGERDSHAMDTHYGDHTLAMEEPVELPAMTPGAAAARAETRVIHNDMAGTAPAPNTSGGLIVAM